MVRLRKQGDVVSVEAVDRVPQQMIGDYVQDAVTRWDVVEVLREVVSGD